MSPRPDLGPPPRLGYSLNPLDRAAERRIDDAQLAGLAGAGFFYAVGGELIVLRKRAGGGLDPLFSGAEVRGLAPTSEFVFLGLADAVGRFAIALDPKVTEGLKTRDDLMITDLRSIAVQALLEPEHLGPLAEGKAMLQWHARHRFCANCGVGTNLVQGGWRRDCPACSVQHFPRTDPVVIMLAIDGERCLLGRQSRFIAHTWSCLAGFAEPGETIEDAVRRETREEAGITCGRVVYFASQPWPFPMSLMIGCHAQALNRDITIDATELENARWFEREEAALMLLRQHPEGLITPPPMAIAHHIIRAWVETGDGVFG